jgi:hypothetical protein
MNFGGGATSVGFPPFYGYCYPVQPRRQLTPPWSPKGIKKAAAKERAKKQRRQDRKAAKAERKLGRKSFFRRALSKFKKPRPSI